MSFVAAVDTAAAPSHAKRVQQIQLTSLFFEIQKQAFVRAWAIISLSGVLRRREL